LKLDLIYSVLMTYVSKLQNVNILKSHTATTFAGDCMVPGNVIALSYLFIAPKEQYDDYQYDFDTLRQQVLNELDGDIEAAVRVTPVLALILTSYKEVIINPDFKESIDAYTLIGIPLPKAIDEYFSHVMLTLTEYKYLDKKNDIRDIYGRFQSAMNMTPRKEIVISDNVILVCEDITVSDFLFLPLERLQAVAITAGHRTSHVVELFMHLKIPLIIQTQKDILSLRHPTRLLLNDGLITLI
jgi:phosphoenolpyruvate-protein kinase (PTS system EI component)